MIRVAVIVGAYPAAEKTRRVDRIRRYSRDGLEVGTIDAPVTPYAQGFDYQQSLGAVSAFVTAFRQAEAEGYDAVVPLGVLDIAVAEGRAAVAIPVVGALFASLTVACTVGARFGLIAYSANLLSGIAELATCYGAAGSIAGYGDVDTDLTALAGREGELKDRFCAVARDLIDRKGADVIISAGISLVPLHLDRADIAATLGVPVIDPIGAPIQLAAAFAELQRR